MEISEHWPSLREIIIISIIAITIELLKHTDSRTQFTRHLAVTSAGRLQETLGNFKELDDEEDEELSINGRHKERRCSPPFTFLFTTIIKEIKTEQKEFFTF